MSLPGEGAQSDDEPRKFVPVLSPMWITFFLWQFLEAHVPEILTTDWRWEDCIHSLGP